METNNKLSNDQIIENFCLMLIEQYLSKKNLTNTLQTFRDEWERPNEDITLFSWYDIALKLRLPELLEQNNKKEASIIENLVLTLISEASIKNRRPQEVIISGLATMPKTTSLPSLHLEHTTKPYNFTTELLEANNSDLMTNSNSNPNSSSNNNPNNTTNETSTMKSKSKLSRAQTVKNKKLTESIERYITNTRSKQSHENSIPEEFRMKLLQRDLMNVKEILIDKNILETSMNRELKRLNVSALDRAKTEENLNATKKVSCGCCMQEFLYVNLPMKVSRKAILDIRVKWSGKLTSETVFRGNSLKQLADSKDASYELKDPEMFNATVPRCYDNVNVCLFCSQFFEEPIDYRPSYQMITYGERKAAYFETKRREREYWDPLKMLEKDRMNIEAKNKLELTMLASSTNTLPLSSSSTTS